MGLPAVPQLQAVLQVPQKLVGTVQAVKILAAYVFFVVELLQSKHRPAGAQPRFASTIDTLEALHQKLNIADASAVNLDVNTILRKLGQKAPPALASDLLARLKRCLDGRKVQRGAIYVRLDSPAELTGQTYDRRLNAGP